ncbi:MAG: 50S ribosomal protein L21 [Vicinamibacteria bacterium]|nr:50S ribosomal protein L21 [Vicinamibacteria bacterium]
MYAIVKTGGKQYRVAPGDVIYVEKLSAEAGAQVTLDDVLFVGGDKGATVGAPHVAGASVVGTVVEQGRERKIRIFQYKKRKGYRRTQGHRQSYTALRIERVQLG